MVEQNSSGADQIDVRVLIRVNLAENGPREIEPGTTFPSGHTSPIEQGQRGMRNKNTTGSLCVADWTLKFYLRCLYVLKRIA